MIVRTVESKVILIANKRVKIKYISSGLPEVQRLSDIGV
jgi:hypothetical protein